MSEEEQMEALTVLGVKCDNHKRTNAEGAAEVADEALFKEWTTSDTMPSSVWNKPTTVNNALYGASKQVSRFPV
jgi:hypothetical protein